MLHLYVCDYLRKRGYAQAAHAFCTEAGLDEDRKAPIDAPQGLLFEWWCVFWDVFLASAGGQRREEGVRASDAKTYKNSQRSKVGPSSAQVSQQMARSGATASLNGSIGKHESQQAVDEKRSFQTPVTPRKANCSEKGSVSPPTPQTSTAPALPQLDLESSRKLNLPRPASRDLIQQCMDMMHLRANSVDTLKADESKALAKRVTRLQTAQNDAQQRLAQLHGLQPPKPLVPEQRAGQKRKSAPSQVQSGSQQPAPPTSAAAKRLSQPWQQPISPLSQTHGRMPLTQISPRSMVQLTPSPSAVSSMHPTMRRPSTSAEANQLFRPGAVAPHNGDVCPPGLTGMMGGTSPSPISQWNGGVSLVQPLSSPLQQLQRPIATANSLSQSQNGVLNGNGYALSVQPINSFSVAQTVNLNNPPAAKEPISTAVFDRLPSVNGMQSQNYSLGTGAGGGAMPASSAPSAPFAGLELDFNALLSGSTQLNREETAALARQLGDVGSS